MEAIRFGSEPSAPTFCPAAAAPSEPEDSTPGPAAIRRAFTRLPLPPAEIVIEPPDGLTLVNLDTNVHTPTRTPIRHTVTLLGRHITIEATPTEYAWTFGDGTTLTTTDPGAPYPDLRTTHAYRRTGTYAVTLATTWTGRYRLTAGPWQPIDATVTTTSPAQQLRVIEATPRLVGH